MFVKVNLFNEYCTSFSRPLLTINKRLQEFVELEILNKKSH